MKRLSGLLALTAFLAVSMIAPLSFAGDDKKEEKKDGHVVVYSDDKKEEKKDGHVVVFGDEEKKEEKKGGH